MSKAKKKTTKKAAKAGPKKQAADVAERCSTRRCKGAPVVDHLGKPLCQKCWDRVAAQDAAASGATEAAEVNPTVEIVTGRPVPATEKKRRTRKAAGEAKPKRLSALDAAAEVLKEARQPMRSQELIKTMAEQGLWSSPNGKTPHATLYAAMLREIGVKGGEARFRKADKGLFEYAGTGA